MQNKHFNLYGSNSHLSVSKKAHNRMLKTLAWLWMVMSVLQMVTPGRNHVNYCKRKCPAFDPPYGAVHLPGPQKYLFYKCHFGIGIMFRCPRRTYFNPKKQVCDWSWKTHAVKCHGSPNYEPEGSGDFE